MGEHTPGPDGLLQSAADITEALIPKVRKYADEFYAVLLDSVQDYLLDNAEGNIRSTLEAAYRDRRTQWERAERLSASNADLLEALKEAGDLIASHFGPADGDTTNREAWSDEDAREVAAQIEAAIAQAEGRSQ